MEEKEEYYTKILEEVTKIHEGKVIFDPFSKLIIGAAIEVHRNLGPGLLESAYEECLCYELIKLKLNYQRQKAIPIVYKEIKLECGYRVDLIVENSILIELKSVDIIHPVHEAQILSYIKFSGLHIGLLINFNVKLLKEGLKRYVI